MDRLKSRIAETIPPDEVIKSYSQLRTLVPTAIIDYIKNITAWLQDRVYENGGHDIFLHCFSEEDDHQHVLVGRGNDEKKRSQGNCKNHKSARLNESTSNLVFLLIDIDMF